MNGSDQGSPLTNSHKEALTIFAVDFIRTVDTVSDAITLPAAMDAATILTFKLVWSAGSRSYKGRKHHGMKPAKLFPVDP